MNEAARKWVEALRSGKYSQAQEALSDGVGFCCLGVACELYRQENPKWVWYHGTHLHGFTDGYETAVASLPREVQEWLDLSSDDGTFRTDHGDMKSLAELNDRGVSFDRIASIIEDEPMDLFGWDEWENNEQ